ncbi:MAG: tetratricopeptide repeat protein [Pseudomonadota bacterium]
MAASDGPTWRFAGCELDVAARELRRDGELVALEPRVFDLLCFLVDERQRAVDKDDIQTAVWRGVIVSETALTRAIMKARRAVGDSADRQAVIRTVHGHGYQFVAELEMPPLDADAGVSTPIRRSPWKLGVAALLVAAIALVAWQWPRPIESGPVRLVVLPVDNATGDTENDWARLALMVLVTDMLAADGRFSVAPATATWPLADSLTDVADETKYQRLRRVLGATHILESRLERSAGALRLAYELRLPDGNVRRDVRLGGEPPALARDMAAAVARDIAPTDAEIDGVYVVSEDPFINEAYSRALGLTLQGRCADALSLLEVVTASDDTLYQARYEWANCARILGRTQESQAAFEQLIAATDAGGPHPIRARALHGLGVLLQRSGQRAEAALRYAESLAEAKALNDWDQQGRVLNSMAYESRDRGDIDEARARIGAAIVAHSKAGAEVKPGQLYAALANFDMAEGKLDDAEAHLNQALKIFKTLGDRRNEAMMLNNHGYLRRLQGRADEAEPFHIESLAIRRDIGDTIGQGRILGMLSVLYLEQGRVDDALARAEEAYRIAEAGDDKLFMATALAQQADAYHDKGDLDTAFARYQGSAALFVELDDSSRAAQVALRLADIDADRGQLGAAVARAADIRQQTLAAGHFQPAIEALELEGDLARRGDRLAFAVSSYEQALKVIDGSNFVGRREPIMRKLVAVHLDREDLSAAEPLIGHLIDGDVNVESKLLQARFYRLDGDVALARARLNEAKALAGDAWEEANEELLRSLDAESADQPVRR